MTIQKPIGIFGGTFDPVHKGHLRVALELLQTLPLSEIRFVPSHIPVHKEAAHATAAQRVAMLKIAIDTHHNLQIDERELHRTSPSYTAITLESFRKEFPTIPLCFILGTDALSEFTTWHRWETILDFAHLIIVPRPGISFNLPQEKSELGHLLQNRAITHEKQLLETLCGHIAIQHISSLDISSTFIREQIAKGIDVHSLLPPGVWEYIQKNQLY